MGGQTVDALSKALVYVAASVCCNNSGNPTLATVHNHYKTMSTIYGILYRFNFK